MAFVCLDVSLFRNFVMVRPAHKKALSDGAEEAGTKVRLPIRGNAITITNHNGLRLTRYKICSPASSKLIVQ